MIHKKYSPLGPWHDEPDEKFWITKTGLPGLILRNSMLVLCGYVGLPVGHKFYKKHYHHLFNVNIHGGLTFSGKMRLNLLDKPLQNYWWFGFDCAHLHDLKPLSDLPYILGDFYRDIEYVTQQVESLAQQLQD